MPGIPDDLGLLIGAGEGNRTPTISLGIRRIGASDRPDLDIRCTASDRDGPHDTGVNGPPMARAGALGAAGLVAGLSFTTSDQAPGSR